MSIFFSTSIYRDMRYRVISPIWMDNIVTRWTILAEFRFWEDAQAFIGLKSTPKESLLISMQETFIGPIIEEEI